MRARGLMAVGLVLLASSCTDRGIAVRPENDSPQIALRRGGRWSVLSLRPPYLNGPHFHLVLKNGVLSGSISGTGAPSGALNVRITSDGAEGHGPLGPVSMDFHQDEASITAEGTWNGGRVHLVFSETALKGTVAINSYFVTRTDVNPAQAARRRRGRVSAQEEALASNVSCEYYLDELGSDGALSGGSTCAGMPQQTRLEVPAIARTILTMPELVSILVTVLSSPPQPQYEDFGSLWR